jgi:hypothetical protein
MDYKDWTYDEFIGYLLIYASHADYIVNKDEAETIIKEIGYIEYDKINDVYSKHSDAEKAELISYFGSKFCTTPEKVDEVLAHLQELLFADNVYKTEEQAFFYGIKMLIG